MERIRKLWEHPLYQDQFHKLQNAEQHRIFCNHTLAHFLDVARLIYIYSLEEQVLIDKEIIYAAAFLHDIGRFEQIASGTPHDEAGSVLAGRILPDCGFEQTETAAIQDAILHHRRKTAPSEVPYSGKLALWLYRADKQSRCCFACSAAGECNWSEEKKNLQITL